MYKIVYGKRLSQNHMDIEVEMGKPRVHVEEYSDEDLAFLHSMEIKSDPSLVLLYVQETILGTPMFKNPEMDHGLIKHIEVEVLGVNNSDIDMFNLDSDEY
jgi:hypothetical protein